MLTSGVTFERADRGRASRTVAPLRTYAPAWDLAASRRPAPLRNTNDAALNRRFARKRFWIRALAAALVVATASLLSIGQTVALAQDKAPDATFRYSGGAVGIGVGTSWGHGTLRFQGKDYPFRMRGLDLANVGASKITASGDVYNLKNIADFSGTYAAASAGALVAGGGAATAMKNDRGVAIRMTSTAEGIQFKLAVEGVTIELEKQPQ